MTSNFSLLPRNTPFIPLKDTTSTTSTLPITVNVSSLHHTPSASSIIQSVVQNPTSSTSTSSSVHGSPIRRRSSYNAIDHHQQHPSTSMSIKCNKLSHDPISLFADITPTIDTDTDDDNDLEDDSSVSVNILPRDSMNIKPMRSYSKIDIPSINPSQTTISSKKSSISSSTTCADSCLICMNPFSKRNPPISIPCSKKCNSAPVHAKCVYEWRERQRDGNAQYDEEGDEIEFVGTCPLCRSALTDFRYIPKDLIKSDTFFLYHVRRNFISHPLPKEAGMVRCYVIITDTSLTDAPTRFEMYLQAPTTMKYPLGPLPGVFSPTYGDQQLLFARKRAFGIKKGFIDISMSRKRRAFARDSIHHCGCVESNFLGTDHTVTSSNVDKNGEDAEIANIKYSQNRFGKGIGPRKMRIALPNVSQTPKDVYETNNKSNESKKRTDSFVSDVDGDIEDFENVNLDEYTTNPYHPTSKNDKLSKLLETKHKFDRSTQESQSAYLQSKESGNVLFGANNEPYWLESIQAFSLDFGGRVVLPSNKNFQLKIEHPEQSEVVLQFGKITYSPYQVYTCDFQWPLSPLQAFGIVLSAMNRKLAVA